MFSNLNSSRFQPQRYSPGGISNWSGHLPFAADLIQAIRPSSVVELGTHYGESYFGFCQSVKECGLKCVTHAVDTWEGDSQTGHYGPVVFEEVSAYNSAHYRSFSTLLRMSFDAAVTRFEDGTIDLLHLDGCHTYEAVKHDFESWFPKVSKDGIILIHDIAVHHGDFGAWRLWEEISGGFPSFAFHHSNGLGVIAKTSGGRFKNPFRAALFGHKCDPQAIRDYYVLCAERLYEAHRVNVLSKPACQVFSPDTNGYSEDRSRTTPLQDGKWVTVDFELPAPDGRLRLDPGNCVSVIEISEIIVECPSTGQVLWRLDPARASEITYAGTAVRIPDEIRLIVLSYGDDPQLYLPSLKIDDMQKPIQFHCLVRLGADFQLVEEFIGRYAVAQSEAVELQKALADSNRLRSERDSYARLQQQAEAESARVRGECEAHAGRVERLEAELTLLRAKCDARALSRQQAEAETWRLRVELGVFSERLGKAEAEALAIVNHRKLLESEMENLRSEARHSQSELKALRASHDAVQSQRAEMKQSLSWRLTAPLRRLGSLLTFPRATP